MLIAALKMLACLDPVVFLLAAVELHRIADAAKVPYVENHGFRRFASNQWSAADGLAGQIIHGTALGVMAHYLDPARHLANVARHVEMPIEMTGQPDETKQMIELFRRANPERRELLLRVAENF